MFQVLRFNVTVAEFGVQGQVARRCGSAFGPQVRPSSVVLQQL